MAERITTGWQITGWCRWLLAAGSILLLLAVGTLPAVAAALRDPTRPPQARPVGRAAGGIALHLPVLESVLLLPGYKAAIIDGQTVMLGTLFRGARLIALTEKTARLRKGAKIQVLHLAPAMPDALLAQTAAPDHPDAALEKKN